jgi:hypothetical protein
MGSDSLRIHGHILLSQIRISTNMEGQVLVFMYTRIRVVCPQTLGYSFLALTTYHTALKIFFVIPFYLQSVLVHSAKCVKNVDNSI